MKPTGYQAVAVENSPVLLDAYEIIRSCAKLQARLYEEGLPVTGITLLHWDAQQVYENLKLALQRKEANEY